MIVRELELDLDAFEGPFDLLLTLVLKDELDLRELDVARIVLVFLERLAEREELDLEACGEFLVLISALLELKARGLFPEEAAELAELEPEAAAEELARRLAGDRRMKGAPPRPPRRPRARGGPGEEGPRRRGGGGGRGGGAPPPPAPPPRRWRESGSRRSRRGSGRASRG